MSELHERLEMFEQCKSGPTPVFRQELRCVDDMCRVRGRTGEYMRTPVERNGETLQNFDKVPPHFNTH